MAGEEILPAAALVAARAWRAHLGRTASLDEPALVAWAAGRINIIGEHTDYNEGWVLPAAIDRVVAIVGRPATDSHVSLYSVHHAGYARFAAAPASLASNRRRPLPLWARYVRATLAEMSLAGQFRGSQGFAAAIAGDVPVGGGLSSSAALEVACATFALGLTGQTMDPMDVAKLCQRAEWRGSGAPVGIMDQAASCLGREGHAILLDCRSLEYTYTPVDLPGTRFLVFDTGVSHSVAASGYKTRKAECEEATRRLAMLIAGREPGRSVQALRDITSGDLNLLGDQLPEVLLKRSRHVVDENTRTLLAAEALRERDVTRLGALLDQSHASLRDLYEVSCEELDIAVELATSVPGVLGARMIGAGFGGSVLALVREEAVEALEATLATEYPRRSGRQGKALRIRIGKGPQWRATRLDRAGDHTL